MPKNPACTTCGTLKKNVYYRDNEKYKKVDRLYCIDCRKLYLLTNGKLDKAEYQDLTKLLGV